ncbi:MULTISPECIES: porin [Sulfitobacter]|uniref:porin n=1 Tax=Sulfitobacter TaxID=60136 RepID=UPI002308195A|nr:MULTISPECIES: porin [Sulfitobacter]MDF3382101.1 porin [Sulfitobacter sp. Ks11]MDF3385520.1 porin [Sulfitobacter sp. M85]MDF3388939.1 porin [Sulfitobacter sp. Ks16]MDF3399576.1 porin [Sulfitobacter sp. KE39]MDF3402997.1 porin [Sulfitobacter sp. Ks35]
MKKVLFATTALVATAGVAAADVTFGGYGRFGVLYTDDDSAGTDSTDITSRFRLQIDATAESDAGVVFGARVRLEGEERDAAGGKRPEFNGVRYFARSGGFEVGVGNIFGALESMPGQYPVDMGLTGLGYDYVAFDDRGDQYSSGTLGNSGDNAVEVLYSAGDLAVHVSASDTDDRVAGYVAYTWSGWTFAVGGQDSDEASDTEWTATAGGSFGIADVTLAYADNGTAGDRMVLAGRFEVGAATDIEVYVSDNDGGAEDGTSYGVDFNHDLGGGTSLRGGVVKLLNDDVQADMGVRFNF